MVESEVERLTTELKRADKNYLALKNTVEDRIAEAVKVERDRLCDWLMNHYLVTTGDHYRITEEEMEIIERGEIPGETLSESIKNSVLRVNEV